jgi:citrate lyase subunit beta / citryl-CoA lyase
MQEAWAYARSLRVMTSHPSNHLLRSSLYVPAASTRALEKAPLLGADVIIHDLEDSVAPEAKAAARDHLAVTHAGQALRVIRVNGAGTPWHNEDIAAAVALAPHALLLPKAGHAEDIHSFRSRIEAHQPVAPIALWAMIETAAGVLDAPAIAATLGPGGALVLGLNDLSRETGMAQIAGRAPMQSVLTLAVLAARQAGVAVLDGVFNAFDDGEGFTAECAQSSAFGFDGKTLIHPAQIAPANRIFAPSDADIAEATAIVALFDDPLNAGRGVVKFGGRMVERLHLDMARAVLHRAALIRQRGA